MKRMSTALIIKKVPRKHVIDEIIKNKMTLDGNMYTHIKNSCFMVQSFRIIDSVERAEKNNIEKGNKENWNFMRWK